MSKKIVFEADVECTSCRGTGLYQGFAERKGAGVVCSTCDGTGKSHIKHEYTPFTKRKKHKKVTRVYKTAGGYGISSEDVMTQDGKLIEFSAGGVSYAEWLEGGEPKPIRDLHCPLEHYCQGSTEGEWLKKHHCHKNGQGPGGYIPDCSRKNRVSCWKAYDNGDFKWGTK